MDQIWEKAREVGRLVAQSDEYKALKRANERLSDDREAVAGINRLTTRQGGIGAALQRGEEPGEAEREEYERVATAVQASPPHQSFEAARATLRRLTRPLHRQIA